MLYHKGHRSSALKYFNKSGVKAARVGVTALMIT